MIRIERTGPPAAGPPPDFVLGLDLGQAADYSALAVLERRWERLPDSGRLLPHLTVRHLQRWPLQTSYVSIVADVCALLKKAPLRRPGCPVPALALDITGTGAPVLDVFKVARPLARLEPVLITAGAKVVRTPEGVWHVAKRCIVGTLQVLLQSRRLKIGDIPERAMLTEELVNFKVTTTAADNETFGAEAPWRVGSNDDCVLATGVGAVVADQRPSGPGLAGGTRPLFGVGGQPLPPLVRGGRDLRAELARKLLGPAVDPRPPGGLFPPGPPWQGG